MTGDEPSTMAGMQPSISLKSPGGCSKEELRCFCDMVAAAGEVKRDGLEGRVGRAEVLAFLEHGGKIIGVGALKRQHRNYIARLFERAHARSEAGNFDLELGWIVVDEAHRGHKYSRSIVAGLLRHAKSQRIYATSVSTNEPMHKTLVHFNFEQDGTAWPSQERKETSLLLFVK